MNKLTWEEFSKNKSFIVLNSDEERALLLKWFKENDYMHLDQAVRGTKMYEGCHSYSNDLDSVSKKERTLYSAYQLEWKKDLEMFTTKYQSKPVPRMDRIDRMTELLKEHRPVYKSYSKVPTINFSIDDRINFAPFSFPPRHGKTEGLKSFYQKLLMGVDNWRVPLGICKTKVFPKVEMLNFNKDKGTTTIKFKNGNVVQSKVNPKETFNEFTGVLVTLLKEVTGMTNQELQGYFKYIMRKEIK